MFLHNVCSVHISMYFLRPFGKWVSIAYWDLQFMLVKYLIEFYCCKEVEMHFFPNSERQK